MKTLLFFTKPFITASLIFFFIPIAITAQINLRSVGSFTLFSTAGAIGNTGSSTVVGNIGTQIGAITGFILPTLIAGSIHNADATTAQGLLDLADACLQINATTTTDALHLPVFGNGETLFAGVYSMAAAASIVDTLRLDGQGDPNAIFIFKVGGALTTAAGATVILINGTSAINVYWKASGAIAMAASTTMTGTMISDVGAVSMGAGGRLEGRLLSATGAVSIYQTNAFLPGLFSLPVSLSEFKAVLESPIVKLRWKTSNEVTLAEYQIERSSDAIKFYSIGRIAAINTRAAKIYTWNDNSLLTGVSFYRLKMIDNNATFKYSPVINIDINSRKGISVFPNPVTGNSIQLRMYGQVKGEYIINLFDTDGRKIKTSKINHDGIDAIRAISVDKNSASSYYLEVSNAGGIKKTIKIFVK